MKDNGWLNKVKDILEAPVEGLEDLGDLITQNIPEIRIRDVDREFVEELRRDHKSEKGVIVNLMFSLMEPGRWYSMAYLQNQAVCRHLPDVDRRRWSDVLSFFGRRGYVSRNSLNRILAFRCFGCGGVFNRIDVLFINYAPMCRGCVKVDDGIGEMEVPSVFFMWTKRGEVLWNFYRQLDREERAHQEFVSLVRGNGEQQK